jgi:RibD C-terminal domain
MGALHRLRGELQDEIEALKSKPRKDIVATGSITLVRDLIAAGLVEEYRLFLYPVVLGHGRRLFADASGVPELRLVETQPFRSGIRPSRRGPQPRRRLPCAVSLTPKDLSLPERPKCRPFDVGWEPGVAHASLRSLHADDGVPVAGFDDLLDLVVKIGDHFPDFGRPFAHPIVAVERALERKLGRISQLHLFVEELKPQLRRVYFEPLDNGARFPPG